MSSQTVYFTNPTVISGLESITTTQTSQISTIQGQVGTTANQINTSLINLTGALVNINTKQFVDKYTYPKGLGPYQVDCIPVQVTETFPMPKFSQNSSTSSGAAYALTGGSNNISYTIQEFDTFIPHDITVYAPSVRTTMQTTPVFQQSMTGEVENQGAFGLTLEDFRGYWNWGGTTNTYNGTFGTTGALTQDILNFIAVCASGTTSTGTRNAALTTLRSSSEYTFLKNNLKYPFKVFNQIKSTGTDGFVTETLNNLNGNPLTYTGADGSTGYISTITSTTYSATGNLLPISQNINSSGAKMGLMLFNLGDGMAPWLDCWSYQAASWGYVVCFLPSNPTTPSWCKYGSKKTLSQLQADKIINITNSSSSVNYSTGYFMNASTTFKTTGDAPVGGNVTRFNVAYNTNTTPSRIFYERYFYTIKCALNKLGLGQYIDYNNVVHFGSSFGGCALMASQNFQTSGIATQYRVEGSLPFLFKTKAMIAHQCGFYEYSAKYNVSNDANQYNNKYAINSSMIPLKTPMIVITGDGDVGTAWSASYNDNRFNNFAQTIFQTSKLANDLTTDQNLAKSAVFYKSSICHVDRLNISPYSVLDGQYDSIYPNSFISDLLLGWKLPLNPQFPSYESIYESGLVDEFAYENLNDVKMINLIQLMAHRFLGPEFPVPMAAMPYFGMKYDLMPTSCDIATDFEYMRVGPIAKLGYDSNYNVNLTSYSYLIGSTTDQVSFIATGSTGYFRNLVATTDLSAPSAAITNATLTNSTISSLTGTNATFTGTLVGLQGFKGLPIKDNAGNTFLSNGATTDSVVCGSGATTNSFSRSVAIGYGATSYDNDTVTIGSATTNSARAIAIGLQASASVANSMAIGRSALANGGNSMAVGRVTNALGDGSIAIGNTVTSSGINTVSMGWSQESYGDYTLNIGYASVATGADMFIIGRSNTIDSTLSDVYGGFNNIHGSVSLSVVGGGNNLTTCSGLAVLGDTNTISDLQSSVIQGDNNTVSTSTGGIFLAGNFNTITETENITVIGNINQVTGTSHSVIGAGNSVGGSYAVVVGDTCVANTNGVAIGKQVQALKDFNVAIGNNIVLNGATGSIGIGSNIPSVTQTGLFINPIRGVAHGLGVGVLKYDPVTFEVTYSTN